MHSFDFSWDQKLSLKTFKRSFLLLLFFLQYIKYFWIFNILMIGGYIVCRTLYQLPILLHIKDKYVIVLPTSRQQLQHYYQLQHISHLARKHIDKDEVKRNYIDLVTMVISTGYINNISNWGFNNTPKEIY